jgi:aspartate-semialdehyde dehydrogenase
MKMTKQIAIVGATGLVGTTMISVLNERGLFNENIRLLASKNSAGKKVVINDKEFVIEELTEESFNSIDVALFSAGGAISKKYAPIAVSKGCIVIDNSSAWRMNPSVPLVVPEVNSEALKNHQGIIANPNCSTIQLVDALAILKKYSLERVIVSTYQSVSGAGQTGVDHLESEIKGEIPKNRISEHQLAYNTVFHSFDNSDLSEEEIKIKNETKKILSLPELSVFATCVRLPILGGHAESVYVKTAKPMNVAQLQNDFSNAKNIKFLDNPQEQIYPTVQQSSGNDETYVGRLRLETPNELHLWVVADNLRKGAASNAVDILQAILEQNLFTLTK